MINSAVDRVSMKIFQTQCKRTVKFQPHTESKLFYLPFQLAAEWTTNADYFFPRSYYMRMSIFIVSESQQWKQRTKNEKKLNGRRKQNKNRYRICIISRWKHLNIEWKEKKNMLIVHFPGLVMFFNTKFKIRPFFQPKKRTTFPTDRAVSFYLQSLSASSLANLNV